MDLLGQGNPEQGTMGGAGSDVGSALVGLVGLVSKGIFLVLKAHDRGSSKMEEPSAAPH
jgi:hypothetical protein